MNSMYSTEQMQAAPVLQHLISDREPPLTKWAKVILWIGIGLAVIWVMVGVNALLHPVPLFGKTGILLSVQTASSLQFSRRSLAYAVSRSHGETNSTFRFTKRCITDDASVNATLDSSASVIPDSHTTAAGPVKRAVVTLYSMKTIQPGTIAPTRTQAVPSSGTVTRNAQATTSVVTSQEVDAFVAMWYGAMGACIQRASGVLLCSGSSVAPDFGGALSISGLPEQVISLMPKTTGGAATAVVLGMMLTSTSAIFHWGTLKPETFIYVAFTEATLENWTVLRKFTIYFASVFAAVSVIATLIAGLTIRKKFAGVESKVSALRDDLLVEVGNVMNLIFGLTVISGLVLLGTLALIVIELNEEKKRRKAKMVEVAEARLRISSYNTSTTGGSGSGSGTPSTSSSPYY